MDTSRIAAFGAFADLPATELDELAAVMNEVEVEAGVRLITSDDEGHFIYFVEKGEADVLADDGEVAGAVGPGDTFGEIAVLVTGQRPRPSWPARRWRSSRSSIPTFNGSALGYRNSNARSVDWDPSV